MSQTFRALAKVDYASPRGATSKFDTLHPRMRVVRLILLCGVCLAWCGILVSRLYSLQIRDFETWQDWALKEHFREVVVASERGPIYDRNGKLMAVSVPASSIYVRPKQVKDAGAVAAALVEPLEMERSALLSRLKTDEPFVWIKRQIPRSVAEKIAALELPGVGEIAESRRYYPYNQAASALIGMVGTDGNGLSGLEARHEKLLHTDQIKKRVTRDAFGNIIDASVGGADGFKLPKGASLKLTIDAALQMIMDEELEEGRVAANAKSAMAVMIDADTGEILGLSQSPGLNFNVSQKINPKQMHNLVAETVFEPGSIMKPIVAAAALEKKVVRPTDLIDCERGRFYFASHTIKDVHPSGVISFRDVLIRSSNIGMTKVGTRLGAEQLHEYLEKFGLGRSSGLELPGESAGILRELDQWAKIDVATHSFGQGVAVTPLQMVRAMSVLANGGKLPELKLIADDGDFHSTRVVSEKTAQQIREMLFGVVEDEHGTGKNAKIDGVRIGGKTGTAQKARKDGRGYEAGAYMASFVGFADARALGVEKNLTLMVVIDEPNTTTIYGGALAAPVFKRIMQRSLHLLAVQNELSSEGARAKVQGHYINSEAGAGPAAERL